MRVVIGIFKLMKCKLILSFVFLMLLGACRKELNKVDINDDKPTLKVEVETNISGLIKDDRSKPVPFATIIVNDKSTQTDINGYFEIRDVYINEEIDFLTIKKPGYFDQVQSICPVRGDHHFLTVSIEEKLFTHSSDANVDFTFIYSDLYEVFIPKNSLVNEAGDIYSGKYKVAPIKIVGEEKNSQFFTSDHVQKLLEIAAVCGIEITESQSNKPLFLNQKISFKYNIKNTPNHSLEVFNYSDTSERVKSLTNVNIENGKLKFESQTLGKLIVANAVAYKEAKGTILADGKKFPFCSFQTSNNSQISLQSRGTLNGQFRVYMPLDGSNVFQFLNTCQQTVYEKELHVGGDDFVYLYEINSRIATLNFISGNIKNCNGDPLNNGYIKVLEDNELNTIFPLNQNGSFEFIISACPRTNQMIQAFDRNNNEQGEVQNITNTHFQNVLLKSCKENNLGFTRYKLENIDLKYNTCQVRKISAPSTLNEIYIFEYGLNGQLTEKVILEKNYDSTHGFVWRISQSSLINDQYQFREFVSDPELFEFTENGKVFIECNIPKLRIENTKTFAKFEAELVYYKALKK